MSKVGLKEREQAFEAAYIARLDRERIEKMHKDRRDEEDRGLLRSASGIGDDGLLQQLLEQGVTPDNLKAMSLVPLIFVAWADGHVTQEERHATLEAAEHEGASKESGGYQLLEAWLEEPPAPNIMTTWKEYFQTVLDELPDAEHAQLKDLLLGRAKRVARASGGILGLGAISEAQKKVLQDLEDALA